MPPYDDDEDWVGAPPEARYLRGRAKPEFWRGRWQPYGIASRVLVVVVIVRLTR